MCKSNLIEQTFAHAAKTANVMAGHIIANEEGDKYIIKVRLAALIKQYMQSHRLHESSYDHIYANYGKTGESYHLACWPQDYPHDVCTDWDNLEHGWDLVSIEWTVDDEVRWQKNAKNVARPWCGEGVWHSKRGPIHITHTSKKPRVEVLRKLGQAS